MSGGVDSSVAAHLLLEQGHEVVGVFMRHGEASPIAHCATDAPAGEKNLPDLGSARIHKQGCCSVQDAEDARRVADMLSIPFYALNLQQEFAQIINYFVAEYTVGRTPNPCVMCNNWLKFGKLFDYADGIAADYVATGHYARRLDGPSGAELHRAVDPTKDQSYFLFATTPAQLDFVLEPATTSR